jgi:hypothetical protein
MSDTVLYKAPTSIVRTGGTAVTFAKAEPPTGSQFAEVNYGAATYREREKIFAYGKEPIPQNGNFSKATRRITLQFPRDLSEVYHLNSLKLEAQIQPEMLVADVNFMVDALIELLISGKYRDFIVTGVVPSA